MLGIVRAGGDDVVVDLPQHARILQRAEATAGVLVADVAFGRNGDDLVALAVGILVGDVFRAQQRRRDPRASPDVVQLQPVVGRRVGLFGRVGRQHSFVHPGIGVLAAGAEAMDGIVDHRLDASLLQRRDHPHVERRLRREQHRLGIDAKRLPDDPAVPVDLADDVAGRDQRHQRMEEAEGGEGDARVATSRLLASGAAQRAVPAGEAASAQPVASTAVELLDQRAAPAGREAGVGQAAADVLAYRGRHEVGVVAAARAEDAVLLAVPVVPVGGVVVRLVHVLVDAEVEAHLCSIRPGTGDRPHRSRCRLHPQPGKRLDPVTATGLADVGLAAAFHLNLQFPGS